VEMRHQVPLTFFKFSTPSGWFYLFISILITITNCNSSTSDVCVVFFLTWVSRHYLCGLWYHPPSDLPGAIDLQQTFFQPVTRKFLLKMLLHDLRPVRYSFCSPLAGS
jgi:hypothetical protein